MSQNKEVQAKLRAELQKAKKGSQISWEEVNSVQYLESVCNETLRLYTPAALLMREATKSFSYKQYTFPKGTVFAVPIQGKQMDPSLYSNPESFLPERWEALKTDDDPFKYMPFWMGTRGCIGKQMAIVEMKVIIAELILNFEFGLSVNAPQVERVLKVTQRPSHLKLDIKAL
eukprot:NODE_785_length_3899_cov_1.070526.p3 type:complete len:173 gc:universal NODE_785_length_3899_cov_1.070526:2755-2237(-)